MDRESLSKQTVPKLKEIAKARGIVGYSRMKKDELITALALPEPLSDFQQECNDASKSDVIDMAVNLEMDTIGKTKQQLCKEMEPILEPEKPRKAAAKSPPLSTFQEQCSAASHSDVVEIADEFDIDTSGKTKQQLCVEIEPAIADEDKEAIVIAVCEAASSDKEVRETGGKRVRSKGQTKKHVRDDDVGEMSVVQLRELAKARGIKNYSKLKKAELVLALQSDAAPPVAKPQRDDVSDCMKQKRDAIMADAKKFGLTKIGQKTKQELCDEIAERTRRMTKIGMSPREEDIAAVVSKSRSRVKDIAFHSGIEQGIKSKEQLAKETVIQQEQIDVLDAELIGPNGRKFIADLNFDLTGQHAFVDPVTLASQTTIDALVNAAKARGHRDVTTDWTRSQVVRALFQHAAAMTEQDARPIKPARIAGMTPREEDIADIVAMGLARVRELAENIGLSVNLKSKEQLAKEIVAEQERIDVLDAEKLGPNGRKFIADLNFDLTGQHAFVDPVTLASRTTIDALVNAAKQRGRKGVTTDWTRSQVVRALFQHASSMKERADDKGIAQNKERTYVKLQDKIDEKYRLEMLTDDLSTQTAVKRPSSVGRSLLTDDLSTRTTVKRPASVGRSLPTDADDLVSSLAKADRPSRWHRLSESDEDLELTKVVKPVKRSIPKGRQISIDDTSVKRPVAAARRHQMSESDDLVLSLAKDRRHPTAAKSSSKDRTKEKQQIDKSLQVSISSASDVIESNVSDSSIADDLVLTLERNAPRAADVQAQTDEILTTLRLPAEMETDVKRLVISKQVQTTAETIIDEASSSSIISAAEAKRISKELAESANDESSRMISSVSQPSRTVRRPVTRKRVEDIEHLLQELRAPEARVSELARVQTAVFTALGVMH